MRQTGRDRFKRFKPIIEFLCKIFSFFGRSVNYRFLKLFRNTNGSFGLVLRFIFLKNCSKYVGDNVSIQPGVFLFNLQNVTFGNNVSIHPLCYIDGAGGLSIGDNVSIAHNCSILTTNHQWDNLDIPIKYNPESFSPVTIKNDVWLGCGVRVMSGVIIDERTIIAAGAVITKNVPSRKIFAGIPAKEIKSI